ncbi:hypothetical protein Goari_000443, partial [Gossypium aridum]|nr:hypothetical protein [Gossypium aridum]
PSPQVAEFVLNYLKELDGVNENLPGRVINPGGWTALKGSSILMMHPIGKGRNHVSVAEAMLCLQAILLGLDLGLLVVEIEGDA